MSNKPQTCYLIGGPHDMTKKVTVQPPKEMIFFEPTNNINLFNLKVFDTSPVKCLPILYKFTHKTSTGMLIYEYKGFENA